MNTDKQTVVAEVTVDAPIEKVWEFWTNPTHIKQWNNFSDDWQTPVAENDLQAGGKLFLRMEKKDGSEAFNHEALYDEVVAGKKISYTTSDDRKTINVFAGSESGVTITETFEIPHGEDPDFHRSFCQSILNSFKTYVETN
jgi:uncharacterized protein YndB with AHSA1/START domain